MGRPMPLEIKATLQLVASGQSASQVDEKAWKAPQIVTVKAFVKDLHAIQDQVRGHIATNWDPVELRRDVDDRQKCPHMCNDGFKQGPA